MPRKEAALAALALVLLVKLAESLPLLHSNGSSSAQSPASIPSVDYVTVEVNSTRSNDLQIFEPKEFKFQANAKVMTTMKPRWPTDTTRLENATTMATTNTTDSEKQLNEEASQNHEKWLTFDGLSPEDYRGPRTKSEIYDTRASDREFQQIALDNEQQLKDGNVDVKIKPNLKKLGLVSFVKEENRPIEASDRQVTASTTLDDGKRRAKLVSKSGPIPEAVRQNIIESFIRNGGKPDNIVVGDSTVTTTSQTKKKTITTVYKFGPQLATGPAAMQNTTRHSSRSQTKTKHSTTTTSTTARPTEGPKRRRTTTRNPTSSPKTIVRSTISSKPGDDDDSDETYKKQAELGEFYRGPKEALSDVIGEINLHDQQQQGENAGQQSIGRPAGQRSAPVIKSRRVVEQAPNSDPKPRHVSTGFKANQVTSSARPSLPQLPPSKVGRQKQSERQTSRISTSTTTTTTTTLRPRSSSRPRPSGTKSTNSTTNHPDLPKPTDLQLRSSRVGSNLSSMSQLDNGLKRDVELGTRRKLDARKSQLGQPDSLEELKRSLGSSKDQGFEDNITKRKKSTLGSKKKTREATKGGQRKQQVQHNLVMVIDFRQHGHANHQTTRTKSASRPLGLFSDGSIDAGNHATGAGLPPAMVNVQIISGHPGHRADESETNAEHVGRIKNDISDHLGDTVGSSPLLHYDTRLLPDVSTTRPYPSELIKYNLNDRFEGPFNGRHLDSKQQRTPINIEFDTNSLLNIGQPTNELVQELVGHLVQRSVIDQDAAASSSIYMPSSGDILVPQSVLIAADGVGLLSPAKAR